MFKAISRVIEALTSTLISMSNVTEKAVKLVENEVDNIQAYQDIRLEENKVELEQMRRDFQARLTAQ